MQRIEIEVTGEHFEADAAALRELLLVDTAISDVSRVGIYRHGNAAAWVSAAFAGIQAAGVIWTWWQSRPGQYKSTTITLPDGETVDLSRSSEEELKRLLQKFVDGRGERDA